MEQWTFFRSLVLTNYQAFDLAISAALCLGTAIYVAFWQALCEHWDFFRSLVSTIYQDFNLAI